MASSPDKMAESILSLGGSDALGGGDAPLADDDAEIDTGDTALGMAASDLMAAIKGGNAEGVKSALRDAIRALVPDDSMEL
jgi:hypothetical protein